MVCANLVLLPVKLVKLHHLTVFPVFNNQIRFHINTMANVYLVVQPTHTLIQLNLNVSTVICHVQHVLDLAQICVHLVQTLRMERITLITSIMNVTVHAQDNIMVRSF